MKIGHAFGDHIRTEKVPNRHHKISSISMRGMFLVLIAGFSLTILLLKLVTIQLVSGEYYRTLSDSNRIRTKIIYAPRGVIMDRYGTPLVYNEPGFRKVLNDSSEQNPDNTEFISHEEAVQRIANGESGIEIDSLRQYPFKEALSHVIGYVGQISSEQLKKKEYSLYDPTDLIGKAGIEQQYEEILKGVNGKQLIEVDALGKPVRTLGQTEPRSGQDITLALDASLQEEVYKAMNGVHKGAVVVTTPEGEILSLVSKPSFDPNLFTQDSGYKTATDSGYMAVSEILLDSENQPLLNRAVSGTYPPGSTFKIITAAAGLEENVITKSFTVQDNGIIRIGPYSFSNWYFTQYGRTEGAVNVTKAIARSNDIYFYKLAEMLSVDRLSRRASQFGVGEQLGIDLAGEEKGVLPTTEWKEKQIGEQWYLGDTFIYGIGQGYLLATPLQVNTWSEVIANGGTLYKPQLLSRRPQAIRKNFIKKETVEIVREGMIQACSTGGTAYPFFNFMVENPSLVIDGKDILKVEKASLSGKLKSENMRRIRVACKTGTAEHGGEDTKPHAWLTVFAPAYKPEIVVTVLVESSGEGSQMAAPIAKQILESYFKQ